jgi:hypothetical protein
MNRLAAALLIAAIAPLALLAAGGLNARAAFVFASVTACVLFVTYFSSRAHRAAGRTESVVATAWLFVRRTVGFLGAVTLIGGAVVVGFGMSPALESVSLVLRVPLALVLAAVGCFCAWVGVFGQGADRYSFKDDVALHLANRRRYKWRW